MVCSMSLVRPELGSFNTDSATTTTNTTTTIITTKRNNNDTTVSYSSYFFAISSSPSPYSSNFTRFLITVLLLLTVVVMSIEGSPVRHRRDTVSQLVNMSKLRNPCDVDPSSSSSSSSMDCSLGDPVKLSANLAKNAITELQKKMGSNSCTGMSLDATFRIPTMATTMTYEEKLREIYKSLLKHYAFMQALSSLNTSTEQSFQSSLASLKSLQCSMLCHLGQSSSFLDEAVAEAGSINVDRSENDESGQILRNCLIINSTLQLLDLLIEVAQG